MEHIDPAVKDFLLHLDTRLLTSSQYHMTSLVDGALEFICCFPWRPLAVRIVILKRIPSTKHNDAFDPVYILDSCEERLYIKTIPQSLQHQGHVLTKKCLHLAAVCPDKCNFDHILLYIAIYWVAVPGRFAAFRNCNHTEECDEAGGVVSSQQPTLT